MQEQLLPITPWLLSAALLCTLLLVVYPSPKQHCHQINHINQTKDQERHEAINSYAQSTLLSLELSNTNDNACDTLRQWCAMQRTKDKVTPVHPPLQFVSPSVVACMLQLMQCCNCLWLHISGCDVQHAAACSLPEHFSRSNAWHEPCIDADPGAGLCFAVVCYFCNVYVAA